MEASSQDSDDALKRIKGPELTQEILESLENDHKPSRIYGKPICHNPWDVRKESERAKSKSVDDISKTFTFLTDVLSAKGGLYQASGW